MPATVHQRGKRISCSPASPRPPQAVAPRKQSRSARPSRCAPRPGAWLPMSANARGSWTTTKPSMPFDWPSSMTWGGSGSPRLPPCAGPSTASPPSPCLCGLRLGGPVLMWSATGSLAREASKAALSLPASSHCPRRPTVLTCHPFSHVPHPQHAASAFLTLLSRPSTKVQRRVTMSPALHITLAAIVSSGATPPANQGMWTTAEAALWNLSPGNMDFSPLHPRPDGQRQQLR